METINHFKTQLNFQIIFWISDAKRAVDNGISEKEGINLYTDLSHAKLGFVIAQTFLFFEQKTWKNEVIRLTVIYDWVFVRCLYFPGDLFFSVALISMWYTASHKRLLKRLLATDAFSSLGKIRKVPAQAVSFKRFTILIRIQFMRTHIKNCCKCNSKHTIKIGHNFKYGTWTSEAKWNTLSSSYFD